MTMQCAVTRGGGSPSVRIGDQTHELHFSRDLTAMVARRHFPSGTPSAQAAEYLTDRLVRGQVAYRDIPPRWASGRHGTHPVLLLDGCLALLLSAPRPGVLVAFQIVQRGQQHWLTMRDPAGRVRYVFFSNHAQERFRSRVSPHSQPKGALMRLRKLTQAGTVLPGKPSWRPDGDFDPSDPHVLLDPDTALALQIVDDGLPGVFIAATLIQRDVARRLDAAPLWRRAGMPGRHGTLTVSEQLVSDLREMLGETDYRRHEVAQWIEERCDQRGQLRLAGPDIQLDLGDGIIAQVRNDSGSLRAVGLAA